MGNKTELSFLIVPRLFGVREEKETCSAERTRAGLLSPVLELTVEVMVFAEP